MYQLSLMLFIIFFALSKLTAKVSDGFEIAFSTASLALFAESDSPIPIKDTPPLDITAFTSAKSILMSPGFMIKSEIHWTPRYKILSIIVNACLNVVFLSMTVKILSFGMTINVSTASFIFLSPSSAFISLFFPSKENGLVTIPTVKIPIDLAIFAITGAAHVPVPHHIPQVINTISVS